jgi:anti-anti-sigma factor
VLSSELLEHAPLVLQHDLDDASARLVVRGALDVLTAPRLDDALALIERWSAPIVIDLCELSFLDMSGLRSLAAARGRAIDMGRPFAIIECPPTARKLFELIGIADMLEETLPEALAVHARG